MVVTYTLNPGPVMRFGAVAIEGLKRLDPAYVERRIRWRQGEIYDANKVEETGRALIESGLFSTVQITPKKRRISVHWISTPCAAGLDSPSNNSKNRAPRPSPGPWRTQGCSGIPDPTRKQAQSHQAKYRPHRRRDAMLPSTLGEQV
jgi:hypothetical protein